MNIGSKNSRQRLKFPMTKLELLGYFVIAIGFIFMAATVFASYGKLPDIIPTHFDLAGNVSWGSKSTIIILPLISIGITVMLTILGRIFTPNFTKENVPKAYPIGRLFMVVENVICVWLFAGITYFIIQNAQLAEGVSINTTGLMVLIYTFIALSTVSTIGFVVAMNKAK